MLLFFGCRSSDREAAEKNTAEESRPPATHDDVRFDPSSVAVGDSVAGLRIEAMDVHPSLIDTGRWVGTVQFEGKRILSGTYRRHPFDSEQDALCFFPDERSAHTLPIFPQDERTSWLCFTNEEEAREWLGSASTERTATIQIDRFNYHYSHSDVYNTARLVGVLSHADSSGAHE